jgi:3-deoxy-7-phosphoheptulonate synthase
MSRASIAAGADGLLIEVHPDPESAWSDAAQTIAPAAFAQLVKDCARVAVAVDRTM